MADLLSSILIGIVLIVGVFFVLHKLLGKSGKVSATIVAMVTVAVYLPLVIIDWPGGDVFAIHIAIYLVTAYMLGIVSSYREARIAEAEPGVKPRWFHWGPTVIVVFFIIIIALDSIFVTMASKGVDSSVAKWLLPESKTATGNVHSYFPGTVSNDYQKMQTEYNLYVDRLEAQKRRGWQVRKGWLETPHAGSPMTFQIEVEDKSHQPIQHAEVVGHFMRPSNVKDDVDFTMQEVKPGVYQAPLQLNRPGNWEVVLYVRQGEFMHETRANTYIEAAN